MKRVQTAYLFIGLKYFIALAASQPSRMREKPGQIWPHWPHPSGSCRSPEWRLTEWIVASPSPSSGMRPSHSMIHRTMLAAVARPRPLVSCADFSRIYSFRLLEAPSIDPSITSSQISTACGNLHAPWVDNVAIQVLCSGSDRPGQGSALGLPSHTVEPSICSMARGDSCVPASWRLWGLRSSILLQGLDCYSIRQKGRTLDERRHSRSAFLAPRSP